VKAEAHLRAIQTQYHLRVEETRETASTNYDISDLASAWFHRESKLRSANGYLVISCEIQDLIRKLLHPRDTVYPMASDTIVLADTDIQIQARQDHARRSQELTTALSDFIQERGIYGLEVTRSLVCQFFGLENSDDIS
jgi:hypothetical protein